MQPCRDLVDRRVSLGCQPLELPLAALKVGIEQQHVCLLHQTEDWLHYRLPENYIRRHKDPLCIGQKQKWFLLGLESDENSIVLSKSGTPEFDDWRWVNYWYPVEQVIEFKRDVYR